MTERGTEERMKDDAGTADLQLLMRAARIGRERMAADLAGPGPRDFAAEDELDKLDALLAKLSPATRRT